MNSKKYFYVPCDGGGVVNNDFRLYFRLYVQEEGGIPKLVEQGLVNLLEGWQSKYKATLSHTNPYPEYD